MRIFNINSVLLLITVILGFQEKLVMAQPIIPPGIPEPGLIIWGAVVNSTNSAEQVSINSAVWSVTDGNETYVYSGSTKPPTQIVSADGQSYYILEVPFDTRSFGAISLSGPEPDGIQSFELQPSLPPAYTLTPTINGVIATVREVNGATKFPLDSPDHAIAGFSAAVRGQIVRVDLAINPPVDSYEDWAAGFFGSAGNADAARTADPDGDGFTNEQEHQAGTDPTSDASRLQILTFTKNAGEDTITLSWQSAPEKSYRIAVATDVMGPWLEMGTVVPSDGASTETTVAPASTDPEHFYRVSVLP